MSTAVTWRDQDARLTVHYENGFTLTDARNEGNGRSQVLWYFPFEKLKRSADDGQRMLWLEFGADESDQVMKYNVADGSCFSPVSDVDIPRPVKRITVKSRKTRR